MYRYVLVFSKTGMVKYISHLDLGRVFKRAFRRSGIDLKYSEGYHPHPRMGICQPLSLGYEGERELLEFETTSEVSRADIMDHMQQDLPIGIKCVSIGKIAGEKKTLASRIEEAVYTVTFPLSVYSDRFREDINDYLSQEKIIAFKKQKKSKELKEVDIRGQIRTLEHVDNDQNKMVLRMVLDCGSSSNLSPELVIQSFLEHMDINLDRYEIEVCRNEITIPLDYNISWM